MTRRAPELGHHCIARGRGAALRLSVLLLFLTTPEKASGQIFSPGKLSRAHGHLDSKCTSCHAGSAGKVTAKECLSCHLVLRRQMRQKKGYHGRKQARKCNSCHKEHRGRSQQLVRWPGGQSSFGHRAVGYPLEGRHRSLACRRCHQPKNQKDPAVLKFSSGRRKRTFLGLERRCASCHSDPHKGALTSSCESCHVPRGFKPVSRYTGHDRTRFPLRGAHRKQPCAKCHRRDGQWRFRGVSTGCESCHTTAHRRYMGQGRKTDRLACRACHVSSGWKKIVFSRKAHPSSIPLRGGHARARCVQCHGRKADARPKGTQCRSCHRDTHERRFTGRCARCHGSHNWRVRAQKIPTGKMTGFQRRSAVLAGVPLRKVKAVTFHNKTRYPLTGHHITVPCQRCHRRGRVRGQRSRIKFKRSFSRCADCHADEHKGQFQDHVTVNARGASDCESCHPLGGLRTTSFSVARHEKSRFPLKGAHRATPCKRCHGRRRPKASRFTYRKRGCNVCHRDKHRGRYRLSATDRKPIACATCHEETSFSKIVFDHSKTRFPLEGRHKKIACSSCHRPATRGGVTVFRGLSRECHTCHADPHQGQFRIGERKLGCQKCHTVRDGFKIPSFDHGKLTRFSLKGAHRKVGCKKCHREVKLKGGKTATLYRIGSTACISCHQIRHTELFARTKAPKQTGKDKLARTFRRCETCHDPRGWRALKPSSEPFDHSLVGYTLRGRHRKVPCGRCHRPGRAIKGRQCNNCHTDRHRGRLGRRACADCHTPRSWRPSEILARHRKTRLPLTGWHALTECSSCHPRSREGVFRGVPAACYGCHAKDYHDPKTHPNHQAAGFARRCEQCHKPTGWTPAAFSRASSGLRRSHPFRLRGRHAQLACVSCHKAGQRLSRRCASCHRKDRQRSRSPRHDGAGFAGDCVRCHDQRGWRPARAAAHGKWFPLSGRHRGLACSRCHTDQTNFRRYTCTSCHDQTTMVRRHRSTTGFLYASRACKRCHPLGRK